MSEVDTAYQLGQLVQAVQGIEARLDRAEASRSEMRADVTDLKTEVGDAKAKLEHLCEDINAMRPTIALVQGGRKYVAGAVGAFLLVGGAVAWGVTYIPSALAAIFKPHG